MSDKNRFRVDLAPGGVSVAAKNVGPLSVAEESLIFLNGIVISDSLLGSLVRPAETDAILPVGKMPSTGLEVPFSFVPLSEALSVPPRHMMWLKALMDVPLALLLLTFLAIPMLLLAVLIKLDSPGPVFFRQPRVGINSQVFRVWKFRTMYHTQADLAGAHLTSRNDPRITRLGALLRQTSIDELPQLFNVVLRDMSLVGPRPHPLNAKAGEQLYAEVVPHYAARHCVLPGITGWAQVQGWRGETILRHQIEQRVEHDLHYIVNWSLWLDLQILLMTVKREIFSRHAF